jgi:DNA-binding transcriptional LysR family regulator
MTFKQFEAFAAAAKHLNITRASEQLHITQPSISKQLKVLEEDYKVKLYFKKKTGGIGLTPEGRVVLTVARRIQHELNYLKRKLMRSQSKNSARALRVGENYRLTAELLPLLASEFKESHPRARVTLCTDSSFRLQKRIVDRSIDIALITRPTYPKGVVVEPYLRHKVVFFVPAGHPLAPRQTISLADLADAPLVVRGEDRARSTSEMILREQGYKPNIALQCESPDAVESAVRRNVGVGILYYECIKDAVERGELKVLNIPEFELKGESFIVYRKEPRLSADARDFLVLLREWKKRSQPSQTDGRTPQKAPPPHLVLLGSALLSFQPALF